MLKRKTCQPASDIGRNILRFDNGIETRFNIGDNKITVMFDLPNGNFHSFDVGPDHFADLLHDYSNRKAGDCCKAVK